MDLRVRRDHVPYDIWKHQGHLLTTEGNVIHYGFIEKFIEELGQVTTYRRSPLTAGVQCRWCKTLRALVLQWFLLGRGLKI